MIPQQAHGVPFSVTHTHATAAVASKAAVTGKRHYITDIMVATDKDDTIMLVKQGTTTIWQGSVETVATGKNTHRHSFGTPLVGDLSALVSVEITGTSICQANIAGFTL